MVTATGRALAVAVLLAYQVTMPQPAILTHYGTGDGFLGQRHSASWQGLACGLPPVVDVDHFGAAGPYDVPLCSRLLIIYGGKAVVVTIVDRMRDDVLFGLPHFDLWPAAAEALGIIEDGIVEAETAKIP